jgi:hypothetical protein
MTDQDLIIGRINSRKQETVNDIASAIDLITKNSSTSAWQISDTSRNEGFRGRGRGTFWGRLGWYYNRGRGRGRNVETVWETGRTSDQSNILHVIMDGHSKILDLDVDMVTKNGKI